MRSGKKKRRKMIKLAIRRNRKRCARLRISQSNKSSNLLSQWRRKSRLQIVCAPKKLYLYGKAQHTQSTAFLYELRKSFATPGVTTVIDMRRVELLMAGGMLLFYAELHRLIAMFPGKSFKFLSSRDETVNEVLEHLGVYGLSGYISGITPERDDVVSWRAATSVFSDGKPVGELIETYESLSRQEVKHIFRGVSEAATNAVEHAYVDDRGDGLPLMQERRWWMFCRESQNKLYVGVCDLGVGIPRSLPRTYSEHLLSWAFETLSLGSRSVDSTMIRAAMELARTRTEKDERGKGLGDMKRVVDQLPGSVLYIFSNRGLLSYSAEGYQEKQYRNSIMGTIAIWIVPLEGNE